jgi:predicted transcriptional regulator
LGYLEGPKDSAEVEALRDLIVEFSARVAELEERSRAAGNRTPSLGFSDEKLGKIAELLFAARIHRANHFDPDLFGEPAWDMLLDLFIHKVAGLRVSSTSLCLGANVPYATGSRYIERLEEKGVVFRFTPPDDRRLVLVDYTVEGYKHMREYISQAVTRFKIPLPD